MDEDFNIYKKYHRNKPIKIENSGLTNYLRIEIEPPHPPTPNIIIFLVQLQQPNCFVTQDQVYGQCVYTSESTQN